MSLGGNQPEYDTSVSRLGYQILRGSIEPLEPRVLLSRQSLLGEVAEVTSLQVEVEAPLAEMVVAKIETNTDSDKPDRKSVV